MVMERRGNFFNASIFVPGLYFRYPQKKDMSISVISILLLLTTTQR
jgi:hypothetical protein